MSKVTKNVVLIPVSEIIGNRALNVREQTDDAYNVIPLVEDMALRGQQTPIVLEKRTDGKYDPIQGFRRHSAMAYAAENAIVVNDPTTGKPLIGPNVKPHVRAIVYEGLTERERIELLLDHGQRRGLNKAELQFAIERAFAGGYTEKEVVTILFTLLEQHYPPSRKIEPTPEARLNYYRGVIQTAKRAMLSPVVLRDAFIQRLRGEQKWPTNSDLNDLYGIHEKEAKENPLLSRTKPGPKFLAKWQELVENVAKAAASGESRPKSVSMRNRQQTEDTHKVAESLLVKAVLGIQLGNISADNFPVIDKIAQTLEASMTDDQRNALVAILTARPTDDTNAK